VHVVKQRLALLLTHGAPFFGTEAIDGPLDLEQRIDTQDRLQGDRVDRFSLLLALAGLLPDIGEFEETPPRMDEGERRRNRRGLRSRIEQRFEAIVAVVLQDAGESGQMLLRRRTFPVAGSVVDLSWRRGSGKGPVISDVAPDSSRRAFAFGKDRQVRVVAVQPLGGEHVALDQVRERLEGESPIADLVRQCREQQINALA